MQGPDLSFHYRGIHLKDGDHKEAPCTATGLRKESCHLPPHAPTPPPSFLSYRDLGWFQSLTIWVTCSHTLNFPACVLNSPINSAKLKKKTKTQYESCELSFIWGKTRTIAQEIASQIALRNCSKKVREGQYICDFGKGGIQAIKHTFFYRRLLLVMVAQLVKNVPAM